MYVPRSFYPQNDMTNNLKKSISFEVKKCEICVQPVAVHTTIIVLSVFKICHFSQVAKKYFRNTCKK